MEVISNRSYQKMHTWMKKKCKAKGFILWESIRDCWYNWSWQHWWSQKLWYWKICCSVSWKRLYIEWWQNELSFSCLFIQIDFMPLPWEQCSWKRFLNKETAVGNSWLFTKERNYWSGKNCEKTVFSIMSQY